MSSKLFFKIIIIVLVYSCKFVHNMKKQDVEQRSIKEDI
jgi:hypothetical protein